MSVFPSPCPLSVIVTKLRAAGCVFAEDEARRRGLREVRLHTNAAMADNLVMYPRLGYTKAGRETRNGFHRVLFVKALP